MSIVDCWVVGADCCTKRDEDDAPPLRVEEEDNICLLNISPFFRRLGLSRAGVGAVVPELEDAIAAAAAIKSSCAFFLVSLGLADRAGAAATRRCFAGCVSSIVVPAPHSYL